MLKKLKWKFIATAMISITIVFILLVSGINIPFRILTMKNISQVMDMICDNEGAMPEISRIPRPDAPGPESGSPGHMPWIFSANPETPFETRFFTIRYDGNGTVISREMNHIASVSEEESDRYFSEAVKKGRNSGIIDNYTYRFQPAENDGFCVFLNCRRQFDSIKSVFYLSLLIMGISLVISFIPVYALSERSISPIVKNMEAQKQFITDISHEIKTPLTVISSHADIMCMEDENNQWAKTIKKETERITGLVSDLVMLSKWDEGSDMKAGSDFDLSTSAWDIIMPFKKLAENSGKAIDETIEENIPVKGDEAAVQTAVSTLLENAVKYSIPGSRIEFNVYKKGHSAVIEVTNSFLNNGSMDISRIFDRFYRADSSRARSSGGYGVGLSIAKAITEAHNGEISASVRDSDLICLRMTLPLKQ